MTYKLHIVALVAFLDAVDADGVPVCRVAGVTSGKKEAGAVSEAKRRAGVQLRGRSQQLPVEVMHGVAGVAGDLVETLPPADGLLDGVLVVEDLVVWGEEPGRRVKAGGYRQAGLEAELYLSW